MSTLTKLTRAVKKLEVPRPLKSATNNVQARNSILDVKINSVEDLIVLTEAVACQITQANYDRVLQTNVSTMYQHLKLYGAQLESLYKDFLDRFFVVFRNGSQDEKLDKRSRLHLLELIELRAKHWQGSDYMSHYYKHRVNHAEPLLAPTADNVGSGGGSVSPTLATPPAEPPTILGPGEIIKTSGKFIKPTKIPGKNYSKDEVVIRNADSGKVMGIKGRRVHMIEELSDTIISFQRVSPGAKERLVQITGPNEENVNHAKHLIGDTIRRNASPVRLEQSIGSAATLRGSASSLNSSASDESGRPVLGSKEKTTTSNRPLLHSFSTNDAALGEYKYTVTFGHHSIKITGNNLDIVKTAKLVLDEYFESAATLEQSAEGSGDFFTLSQRPGAALLSHDLLGSLGDEPSFLRASNGLPDAGDDEVFTNKPPGGDERGSKTTYSYETMVHYAASPLSRAPPSALAAFPSDLQRKSCLQFDGEAYLKKVAAAGVTLLSALDDTPDSPEPE